MNLNLNFDFNGFTTLKQWWNIVKSNFQAIKNAHDSTQEALTNMDNRIDNIVASPGSSSTEVVDARHSNNTDITYTTLGERLDQIERLPNLKASTTTNTVVIPNAVNTTLSFVSTKSGSYDDYNMLNENEIICKKSGKYRFSFSTRWLVIENSNFWKFIYIKKNGTTVFENGHPGNGDQKITTSLLLNENDVISFVVNQNSSQELDMIAADLCIECFELI